MKKISNSNANDCITKEGMGTMTNADLQVMFDIVVDGFDPDDDFSVEDTNYEMRKNWRKFLEAGFDATSVANMMSPADVWEHYDELLSYGAKIDMTKLFSAFGEEPFDKDFTQKHWDELASRGVSPDLLVDRCYYDCDISNTADLEELLEKGVSLRKAFEKIQPWLDISEEWPEEQVEILTWFHDHGLPKVDIREWLVRNAHAYMEDYVVESGSDLYKKYDLETDTIIDHWLSRYGYRFFSEEKLSNLPDTISIDKLISFFSMKEIIDNCSPYSFDQFISDYLESDQDINVLAQKFMDEIGYSSNSSDSGALLDLVYARASVDIIDPAKYIDLVDVSQLDDCEASNWYYYYEDEGYDSQRISKFLR